MEIRLSPEIEAAVARDVANGRFTSVEEYVSVAVELLHEREQWLGESLEEEREKIEASWQEAERGEVFTLDEVRRDMRTMKSEWTSGRHTA